MEGLDSDSSGGGAVDGAARRPEAIRMARRLRPRRHRRLLSSSRFRPGRLFALAAGLGEFTSGLLVALGFLGPLGPALMVSVMLVAMMTAHAGKGLFASTNGIEVPLLYAAAASTLVLIGPGAWSLDSLFGLTAYWTPEIRVAALGIGIGGAVANLAVRRRVPQTA